MRTIKEMGLPGTRQAQERDYELKHLAIARRAAAAGLVLLKNEEAVLPLKKDEPVVLYGVGAARTVKGGTGSGEVNERKSISIYEGIKAVGGKVANEDWLKSFDAAYEEARTTWADGIKRELKGSDNPSFFGVYCRHPFISPVGEPVKPEKGVKKAIFVISRNAGEGADRREIEGDYYLTKKEREQLSSLSTYFSQIILLINAGSVIDLNFLSEYPKIKAVMVVSQPGQAGGLAVADVLYGQSPCGKLVDTWAIKYEDYPSSARFSSRDGDIHKAYYEEGIYVGYRYFDTFSVKTAYPFGFGLSYTSFEKKAEKIAFIGASLQVTVSVKNTGKTEGREVVELYDGYADPGFEREYHRLIAFAKTGVLNPGETETVTLAIPAARFSSFKEETASEIIPAGTFFLFLGESIEALTCIGAFDVEEEICLTKLSHVCPLKEKLTVLHQKKEQLLAHQRKLHALSVPERLVFSKEAVGCRVVDYEKDVYEVTGEARALADSLPLDTCVSLLAGDPDKSQEIVGNAGQSVPGAAAETSSAALSENIVPIVLADGPAGLRLQKSYDVIDGKPIRKAFMATVDNGIFAGHEEAADEVYYQYCTAFPVGTLLAQTWDEELVREVGEAVAAEMREFYVTLWLAPGMNIHRNPLCGRNFEYYSEDPFVSGKMAAAITRGVQRLPGCGTTIKHFVANNCEENRTGCDSVVDERTLREIYLKGFEIAVKESQPMAIMTSYNLMNGIHTANDRDLLMKVSRAEWGFKGLVMTDWTTTNPMPEGFAKESSSFGCILAGNDLIMPGMTHDIAQIKEALKSGALKEKDVRDCAARIIRIVLASDRYEDAVPYDGIQ